MAELITQNLFTGGFGMHIRVKKQDLLDALSKNQGITEKRNIIEILSHFLLVVEEGSATIFATDNETAVRVPLNAEVFESGRICIPAKTFREIVKELEEQDVELKLDEKRINIHSGKSKFKLAVLDASDFPVWLEPTETNTLTLSRDALLTAIEKTIYAAGDSDARYVLNGLLFHIEKDSINFVATDGHRLAHVKFSAEAGIEESLIILSQRSVSEFKKLLSDIDAESISLKIAKTHILCEIDGIKFLTRLVEGSYPDYKAVILTNNNKMAVIDRKSFINSLKRVSILSKEHFNTVILDFNANSLVISSSVPDFGEAKDELEIDYHGEPLTIAFNADYLIDALEHAMSDKVEIAMSEPDKATYITDAENNSFLYECVVMPVRV